MNRIFLLALLNLLLGLCGFGLEAADLVCKDGPDTDLLPILEKSQIQEEDGSAPAQRETKLKRLLHSPIENSKLVVFSASSHDISDAGASLEGNILKDARQKIEFPTRRVEVYSQGFANVFGRQSVVLVLSDVNDRFPPVKVQLSEGQSFNGLEVQKIQMGEKWGDDSKAVLASPDGRVYEVRPGHYAWPEREIGVYDFPRPVDGDFIEKLLKGDESALMSLIERRSSASLTEASENLSGKGGDGFIPDYEVGRLAEEMALLRLANLNSMDAFVLKLKHLDKTKSHEDDDHPRNSIGGMEVLRAGYWSYEANPGSGKIRKGIEDAINFSEEVGLAFISTEYVSCDAPIVYPMPPWALNGGETGTLQGQTDQIYDDKSYLLRLCKTDKGEDGICCKHTCKKRFNFEEIKKSNSSKYINECKWTQDECGRPNEQYDGLLNGRPCPLPADTHEASESNGDDEGNRLSIPISGEIEDSIGKCYFGECVPKDKKREPDLPCKEWKSEKQRYVNRLDGIPCAKDKVCKNGECIVYNANDWKDFLNSHQDLSGIKASILEVISNAISDADQLPAFLTAGYSAACYQENEAGLRSYKPNGITCMFRGSGKSGNCWMGACGYCDSHSDEKIIGSPSCPPSVSWPGKKGVRLSCVQPDICVY